MQKFQNIKDFLTIKIFLNFFIDGLRLLNFPLPPCCTVSSDFDKSLKKAPVC